MRGSGVAMGACGHWVGAAVLSLLLAACSTSNKTNTPAPDPSPTTPPDLGEIVVNGASLFPTVETPGSVIVTLHPGPNISLSAPTAVAFGMPFPRGLVKSVSNVSVTDVDGVEIASHIEELAKWRSLSGDPSVDSVRSALIFIDVSFTELAPLTLSVTYGQPRLLELGLRSDVKASWGSISNGPHPDEYPASESIEEPAVYVTLPADWLSLCLLRTRTTPVNDDNDWLWFDEAIQNFALTAVNEVSPLVTAENLISYSEPGKFEPWQLDRALTLFNVYIRTGDVKWLRHAHRAAQFYANHIDADGYFDLKDFQDLKYSYGHSMLVDLLLTGDTSLVATIERVANAAATWNATYSVERNFWTSRHHTYALLGALAAWEATGKQIHAERAIEVAQTSFSQALTPPNGWNPDGCLLHTLRAHGDGDAETPVCSPWMHALFADAILRYYIHSEDSDALVFLANLGDYIKNYALYTADDVHLSGKTMPWYLASSTIQITDGGPWADWEHTCDVAGLLAKAVWAKGALSEDIAELTSAAEDLIDGCKTNLDYWHRIDADINSGNAVWRLSPPRKFNWWFGTTSDMTWLLSSSP